MQIKCVGRRSIEITKNGDYTLLTIYWKGNGRIAGLEFEKKEVFKLIGELLGSVNSDSGKE